MSQNVSMTVNGTPARAVLDDRLTLVDYIRDERQLTGTRVGCEQGACGSCTVLVNGRTARSCLMLAAQADGASVLTVEGLAAASPAGSALQRAFADHDAVQCGYCTPGMLMTALELLSRPVLDEPDARAALSGNLCRCTGYSGIVAAVLEVHRELAPVGPLRIPSAPVQGGGRDPDGASTEPDRTPTPGGGTRRGRRTELVAWVALAGVAVAVVRAVRRRRSSNGRPSH